MEQRMTQNLFDLTGKYAVITGATKGIGRAIAEAFADHGASFALTSRHPDEARAAAEEINQRVGREAAIGLASDLYDRDTRSEEHTSELQSLMSISYAVFCLKKKKTSTTQ